MGVAPDLVADLSERWAESPSCLSVCLVLTHYCLVRFELMAVLALHVPWMMTTGDDLSGSYGVMLWIMWKLTLTQGESHGTSCS